MKNNLKIFVQTSHEFKSAFAIDLNHFVKSFCLCLLFNNKLVILFQSIYQVKIKISIKF